MTGYYHCQNDATEPESRLHPLLRRSPSLFLKYLTEDLSQQFKYQANTGR